MIAFSQHTVVLLGSYIFSQQMLMLSYLFSTFKRRVLTKKEEFVM